MIENLHEQLLASVARLRQQFPIGEVSASFEAKSIKAIEPEKYLEREGFCVGVANSPSSAQEYGFGSTLELAEAHLLTRINPEKLRAKVAKLRAEADNLERSLGIEVAS